MKVDSYIKIQGKALSDDFTKNPHEYFIHIDDKEEIFKFSDKMDSNYIEGAIILKYNNNSILDFDMWDLIGPFWAYLLNCIEDVMKTGKGYCYLPDQPIRVDLSVVNAYSISIEIGEGKYGKFIVPIDELVPTLLSGAEHFFEKYHEYFHQGEFDFHIQQIMDLRKLL